MLSIIETSSTKMETYLATLKTFLILHSTISHKILAISHTKKSFQYFLGLFFNLKKTEQIFQAFILYHGPTLTQNMKARCNLGFLAFFLSFNANTYLWEDIHWLKSEIKRQTTFFFSSGCCYSQNKLCPQANNQRYPPKPYSYHNAYTTHRT